MAAKNRMVNTRFWADSFVANLKPSDRYIFLYLITNEHTNISGIYELPMQYMCMETGVTKNQITKTFERLQSKIFYKEGWVCVRNFQKYQASSSELVQKALQKEIENVPSQVYELIEEWKNGEGIDTLSIPSYPSPIPIPIQEQEQKQKHSLDYLAVVPAEDVTELSEKYKISPKGICEKATDLRLYCEQKGKQYKNYKSFLENALRKDKVKLQNEYPFTKVDEPPPEVEITPEQQKKNEELRAGIRGMLKSKRLVA